jgi:lipoate synthase
MPDPADELDSEEAALPALEEGRDYYLEQGLMVFTATFLLRRGYCCERGCRHCPYGYARQPDSNEESDAQVN